MKQKYLLDSRTLLDHLCGRSKVTQWLKKLKEGEAIITTQSRAEVLVACGREHRPEVLQLLDHYPTLSVSQRVADDAADLTLKHQWSLEDSYQVALAELNKLIFVTVKHRGFQSKNKKHILILN